MSSKKSQSARMAELVSALRRLCDLKDHHLVKKRNITNAERNCLIQFSDTDTMGMKELSKLLDITPAGVTRIVRSLENKGIAKRQIDQRDRRGVNVVLTSKGAKMAQDISAVSDDMYRAIMYRIEPENRKSVMHALEQLVHALETWLHSQDEIDTELTDSILDHYGIGHWELSPKKEHQKLSSSKSTSVRRDR